MKKGPVPQQCAIARRRRRVLEHLELGGVIDGEREDDQDLRQPGGELDVPSVLRLEPLPELHQREARAALGVRTPLLRGIGRGQVFKHPRGLGHGAYVDT